MTDMHKSLLLYVASHAHGICRPEDGIKAHPPVTAGGADDRLKDRGKAGEVCTQLASLTAVTDTRHHHTRCCRQHASIEVHNVTEHLCMFSHRLPAYTLCT